MKYNNQDSAKSLPPFPNSLDLGQFFSCPKLPHKIKYPYAYCSPYHVMSNSSKQLNVLDNAICSKEINTTPGDRQTTMRGGLAGSSQGGFIEVCLKSPSKYAAGNLFYNARAPAHPISTIPSSLPVSAQRKPGQQSNWLPDRENIHRDG